MQENQSNEQVYRHHYNYCLMKRVIRYIVVHCTNTPPDTKIKDIERYWKQQLGWENPGYHYIIERDGKIVQLLQDEKVANGVKDFNQNAIHISYIGGVDHNNRSIDNRTDEQKTSLFNKLMELMRKYPLAKIMGHYDFPNVAKACPSFNVAEWLKEYMTRKTFTH
jgi:N-acetylmuramoyl-L-alanine amidase